MCVGLCVKLSALSPYVLGMLVRSAARVRRACESSSNRMNVPDFFTDGEA